MHGDTNFKVFDLSDPSVYLYSVVIHVYLSCTLNYTTTRTLLSTKISEFWDELLNAKDRTVYQIEAIKKFYFT